MRCTPIFMTAIHITDIEAAINHWRQRLPSSAGMALAPQVQALAEVYALMVYRHEDTVEEADLPLEALDAWLGWYDTTPDTPCIAICSTSQGDDLCKGCGRTFDEVQHWPAMGPAAKRQVWRRITLEHTAWRFTRYAERAAALLQELQDLPQRRWACRCGEIVEGGFEQCWQCGALMPRD